MSGPLAHRRARRPLGELNPDGDLNAQRWPRGILFPISDDEENREAVRRGLSWGYYDPTEVAELT